jgi:predicted ATPase/DNA-binding CsgD family transcriptional regulator
MSNTTLHNHHHLNACEFHAGESMLPDAADLMSAIGKAENAAERGLLDHAIKHLEEALRSYQDDLLPGRAGSSTADQQVHYDRCYTMALERLVRLLEEQDDYATAVEYARCLRRYDPVHDETYQRLVHLHVLSVDRAGALQALRGRLMAATRGQGALVLIRGPPGIGKTSLALACTDQARSLGAVFATAHCYERATAPAYAPWHELLRQLDGMAGMDLDALPEPFGSAPPAGTAYRLGQIICESLGQAAAERPVVLLLDDLHWADQDTLDLLDLVTRCLSDLQLLVIVTYRSEQVHRRHPLYDFLPTLQRDRPVETIRLAPLSPSGTARLVEARHGACSPELATYLHERSEGNPLFLVELLSDLFERNVLAQGSAGRWSPPRGDVPLPTAIQQIIAQRVDRLGADVGVLLEVAAVIGKVWDLSVAEVVLDWPEDRLLRALEDVLAVRLVLSAAESGDRYQFAHGLIREVLYNRPLARRRNHLHARIGRTLEERLPSIPDGGERQAELAHHFYTAGMWDKARQYSLAAGDAARQRYANHSAAQFYEQALEAVLRSPEAQSPETGGAQLLVSLYERLGQVYMVLNHKAQAEAAFSQMLEAARTMDGRLAEGRALSQLIVAREWLYRFDEARATGERALVVAEQVGDRRLLALTHRNLGHLYVCHGDLVRSYHHLERSEALARAEGEDGVLAPCLQNQAYIALFRGDYERAERLAREALALAQAGHNALTFSGACFALGLVRGERGQYERARQAIQTGMERARASGERHYLPKLLNTMGWLYSEVGDYETARQWDTRALQVCRDETIGRDGEAECYALLNLATDALCAADMGAAERYVHEFQSAAERGAYSRYRFTNRYRLLQAELALARGDADAAAQHAREAASMAEARGMLKNLTKGYLYQGRALLALGHLEESAARLQRAVTLADQIDHGSLRWRARLRLGQAQAVLGQPHAEVCRQALDLVRDIASDLQDEHLRNSFTNSPPVRELANATERAVRAETETGRQEPAAGRPATAQPPPAGLSPREIQVLRLVAQGATNRTIAEALTISVKTVNAHVTHILNKTNCANRAAAAAFAVQHGLA